MSDDRNLAWLRLSRTEQLGPVTVNRLLARYHCPIKLVDALAENAAGLKKPVQLAAIKQIEQEWQATSKYGAIIIGLDDPRYPPLLRQIDDAPPCLIIKGDIRFLHGPVLAIVGTRNASANARRLTSLLAEDMAKSGWSIASGLARGIDTAAHEATIGTGTIAVIAGGIDAIYPTENTTLYYKIAEQGCIISEGAFGQPPAANLFPRRNRIVSGLSYGVLVIEAALRSGSLVTAHRALDQGREVFAVPGSPLDPRCRGSNKLLKDGATLVEEAADILHVLNPMRNNKDWQPQPRPAAPPKTQQTPDLFDTSETIPEPVPAHDPDSILQQALSMEPVGIDTLIQICALPAEQVMARLMEWELMGTITRHPGNRVSLAAS